MAATTYFTSAGPKAGTIMHRGRRDEAMGVLEAPGKYPAIGLALSVGWDDRGRSLYRLIVHKVELPGRSVVVDREFRPAG
jgi:hypothetical protein